MHRSRSSTPIIAGLVLSLVLGACSSGAPAAAPATDAVAQTTVPPLTGLTVSTPANPTTTTAGQNPAPNATPAPVATVEAAVGGPAYTIDQAISDRAQLNTIAFDALGFLTGNIGSDSFFPPGKVADFWGFQYLRDNDPTQMGHNTDFLTRAAGVMLNTLTSAQRAQLIALGKAQVANTTSYATKRFTLMAGFRRLLTNKLPTGTTRLDAAAVGSYSASLYAIDGRMTLARAAVMGPMLASLTSTQRATLDALKGTGMTTWPVTAEPSDMAGLAREVKEAVMTYASDMFSWYVGSVEADTYFCPERHGTYFGSFYLKDAPAVGNPGYSIDTTLTGNLGAALLAELDSTQAAAINGIIASQRPLLLQIVETRRAIATKLRVAMTGGTLDTAGIATLMTTYGKLDGQMVASYATAFAKVGRTLTATQKTNLVAMRTKLLAGLSLPTGAYLYSTPIAMPTIPSTDFLFR